MTTPAREPGRASDASRVRLGQTNVIVPRLGVGTMNWGDPARFGRFALGQLAYGPIGGLDEQRQAVDASVEAGAGLFDTAGLYGGGASERALGTLLGNRPAAVFTKFPSRLSRSRASDLPRALDESLARLQRQSVELYLVHSPFPWLSIPGAMARMADAVTAGRIGAVGVSNFTAPQVRRAHRALGARGIPLAAVEVEYSLLHRAPETNGVLAACRELGIALIAYMPLAMGMLTGKYSPQQAPAGLRRFMRRFRGQAAFEAARPVTELLADIGERHGKSPTHIALRWLIQQGDVIVIPGARNGAQARHNAGALTFALSAAELEALAQASAAWRP